jgi:hypothetical protein
MNSFLGRVDGKRRKGSAAVPAAVRRAVSARRAEGEDALPPQQAKIGLAGDPGPRDSRQGLS